MCDSCKLVYLKSYVLENANFLPISQICYFQDKLITFFVTNVCPIMSLEHLGRSGKLKKLKNAEKVGSGEPADQLPTDHFNNNT